MGVIDRFLSDSAKEKSGIGLQVLFGSKAALDGPAITQSLRRFDPSMAKATCELDAAAARQGTPIGLVAWGSHVIRVVGFDVPMPPEIVELCVAPSHYGAEIKAQARAHQAHVLLYYAGREREPLEQYVALAAFAAALSAHGAIVITNEAGHTSLPARLLAAAESERVESLRSLPILICTRAS